MKKFSINIVTVFSLIILFAFTIANLFFIVTVTNFAENVFINFTTSVGFVAGIVIDIVFLYFFKILSKKDKIISSKYFILILILIYSLISAIWVNNSKITPIDDSESVNNLAIDLAKGNMESIEKSEYLEKYPNQIGVVNVLALFYKIFNTDNFRAIQYLNIISNVITIIFMYYILKNLSNKYSINKIAYYVCTLTFIPLIMLTTYVYGDYLGLCFSIIGIYFVMRYKKKGCVINLILSAIFMGLSYFTKMNYIIVIIAILIYLFLYLIEEKNKARIYKSIIVIMIFSIISILPFTIFKNIWISKFNIDRMQSIPTSVWIYIGMCESYRAERMV